MKVILICGPWGGGTSAVAGLLERIGALGLGPYFMTGDPNTPNSYESVPFRETILRYANQPTLSLISCAPGAVQSGLRSLQRRIEQREFGPYDPRSPKPIFLKYPLSALMIPEICEVFDTKLIYVMRPLEDIERTRLRRNWLPYFGAEGAAVIYNHMSAALKQHAYPTLTIDYSDLLASPMVHACNIARFVGLEPSPTELRQAADIVKKQDAFQPSEPVAQTASMAPVRNWRHKICLCMIVKDEAAVILRCLELVRPIVDCWIIVDTGSTDGTQDVIQRYLHDLPGELHQRHGSILRIIGARHSYLRETMGITA